MPQLLKAFAGCATLRAGSGNRPAKPESAEMGKWAGQLGGLVLFSESFRIEST